MGNSYLGKPIGYNEKTYYLNIFLYWYYIHNSIHMNSNIKLNVLSIISEIANTVQWNKYVNEHYSSSLFHLLSPKEGI